MRKNLLFSVAASLMLLGGAGDAYAQSGEPHSLKADAVFSDVTLSWKAPADKLTLQWHDDNDYNGLDGIQTTPGGSRTIYSASRFTAEDLAIHVGQKVDSLAYYEYRYVVSVDLVIYEDGKEVYTQKVDQAGYEKSAWKNVPLETPYVIPAGKEVMFAFKFVAGSNMDFVASTDRSINAPGKGDLFSYDGKEWMTGAPGDFMITAFLHNDATEAPTAYNIYRDGAKVAEAVADATDFTLLGEADGEHKYQVAAVYGAEEKKSVEVTATALSVYSQLPPVATIAGAVENLTGTLNWAEPLKRGTEATWSNKTFGTTIGGTATKAKVWVKQEFSAEDMAAFPNHKITAINSYLGADGGGIDGVTLFIMKDGAIVYFEEVSADAVAALQPESWNKFALSTPYVMELGSTYAFGLYYTHPKGVKPIGVDNGQAVVNKGNSFSTSSPSSKGFDKSNPSWKTLSSGDIPGNFMMTADVEALNEEAAKPIEVVAYDIYRNGTEIAKDVKALTYTDVVDDLGTYTYSIVAKSADGKKSPAKAIDVTYSLPAEYVAPVILDYDQNGKDINFSWSSDAFEMKHYGTATYIAGFAEELPMMYGAKFAKEELAECAGYELHSLKFGIGDALDAFKLQVITSDGEVLMTKEYKAGDVEPGYLYSETLEGENRVKIPADKDLYLVYNATLPANTNALLLDGGPEVDGGAVVSLTNGMNWMKLGTIAPDFAGLNIVISALAVPAANAPAKAKAVELGNTALEGKFLKKITTKANTAVTSDEEAFGVKAQQAKKAPAMAAAKPKAKSYKIYCNNQLVMETEGTSYVETLPAYGVFNYNISTVYENGWESPATRDLSFNNLIAQKSQAPYNLQGVMEGENLNLTWQAVDAAPELLYHSGEEDFVFGFTKSSGVDCYIVNKYAAAEMTAHVGSEVAHVKFKLADTNLNSASVVVMYDENIVYEQEVAVSDLVVGWNTVRLNNPVPVVPGKDICVGYHLNHPNGVKPIVADKGPAVQGYGDFFSMSGSADFWYSLLTKFGSQGFDCNWRINAVLKTADAEIAPMKTRGGDAANVTYTVYCNGEVVASGLTSPEYTVMGAKAGEYAVSATVDGTTESAESNTVTVTTGTGIAAVEGSTAAAPVYAVDGKMVQKDNLKKGVYIQNGKKYIVK